MFDDNKIEKSRFTEGEALDATKTVQGLWTWAKALHSIGAFFCGLFIVLGVIALFACAFVIENVGILVGVCVFIGLAIMGTIFYLIFHTMALLVSSSASTTYNTMVTAKCVLTTANFSPAAVNGEGRTRQVQEPGGQVWYCTKCCCRNDENDQKCRECGADRREYGATV